MNKALIFDMGGVLVDLDVQACKDAFKQGLGYMRIDSLIDACHQKGIYGELEEGMLSAEDFRSAVLSESHPAASAEDVDRAMWKMLVGIEPYKVEMLSRLSEDYDLYLLSNNNPICLARSAAMFEEAGIPLDKIFKKCFFSFGMKMLKPSVEFYREVMRQIALPACDMLFIDDSMKNVEGAVQAGLPAVYYEPGTDLDAFMRLQTAKMLMVRFMSLSSGSCGNCYYLGTETSGILIDAGVSLRRLKKALAEHGLDHDSFSAVLVTHDHLDHIRHLGSYCKRLSKPVYTAEAIHKALARHTFTASAIGACRKVLVEGEWNEIAGMKVRYFTVPHDATQTVGYAIMIDGHNFLIMTDVGRVTDEAVEFAGKSDTVVIESNYDMDMLMGGRYTYELKMRIVQGCGHLSNDECASAIKRFWHPSLRNIFLCHLSENNNTHDLAYRCSCEALEQIGVEKGSVALRCLPRQYPSEMFYL